MFFLQIYNTDQQIKYDKNIGQAYYVPIAEGKKNIGFNYIMNKKQYTINARDYYEKTITFFHNNKLYKYGCNVVNSENKIEIPKDTVRAETLYNFGIMERDVNDDNKLKLITVT